MLTDFSRLLLLTFADVLRRAGRNIALLSWLRALPALFAEVICARRMEAMVRRIDALGRRIDLVHGELQSGHDAAAIMDDARFRRMLAIVKDDMQALRSEAAAWQGDAEAAPGARMVAALAAVAAGSERVHTLADIVLTALNEHDRQRLHHRVN